MQSASAPRRRRRSRFQYVIWATASAAYLGVGVTVLGETYTWDGAASGNFNDPTQWTDPTNDYPNSKSAIATIPEGNSTVFLNVSPSIASISVGTGDTLSSGPPGNRLTLYAGATVNGTIDLAGGSNNYFGDLSFQNPTAFGAGAANPQTVGGTGVISLGSSGNSAIQNLSYSVGPTDFGDVITLGAGITIHGAGFIQGARSGVAGQLIINQGTINADVAGGTLHLDDFSNSGTVEATNGGTLNLGGSLTTAQLGYITSNPGSHAGIVQISGTLTNTGATFSPATATGPVTLSGKIQGGTVGSSGEHVLYQGGTLSAVTLSGDPLLPAITYAPLNVQNGLTFSNGAILELDGGAAGTFGNLDFINPTGTAASPQTIGGTGTISLGSNRHVYIANESYYYNGTTKVGDSITFGPNVTIHGNGVFYGAFNGIAGQQIINQGTINADVAGEALYLDNFSNSGTLEASNAGTLYLRGTFTVAQLGFVNSNPGANSGTVLIAGTLNNTGTNFAATTASGPVTLSGTIEGGTVSSGGSQVLYQGGTVSGIALNGNALGPAGNGSSLNVENGLTMSGGAILDLSGGVPGNAGYLHFVNATGTNASPQFVGGTGTINLGNYANTSFDNQSYYTNGTAKIGDTITIGPGITIQGAGAIRGAFSSGAVGQQFINQGTIDADVPGGTLYVFNLSSSGTLKSTNGSTLRISTGFANLSSNTLTGGAYTVDAISTLRVDAGTINTNSATITLNGVGSNFLSSSTGAALESTLMVNAGTLEILANRGYASTVSGGITNTGTIQLGGGTFSAASITNSTGGQIFGFGSLGSAVPNSGTIRANGGTLGVSGVTGTSGTLQSDAGATLDLSSAASASTTGTLANYGGLNLGSHNLTVSIDYVNTNFGTGNAFNSSRNVSGAGLINAAGDVGQSLSGSAIAGGATAAATLAFGNLHVGDSSTMSYQINATGSLGPSLRGAIQTAANGGSITSASLSGAGVTAGNFGPLAPGASDGPLSVTYSPSAAGPLNGQVVHILSNFGNIATQGLTITGTAFNLAQPAAPSSLDFGIVHVGDAAPATKTVMVSNAAPAGPYSEKLDASFGSSSSQISTSGSLSRLLAGSVDNTSMSVALNTSTASTVNASVPLNFASDGTGTSGLANTTLMSQTLSITGTVNNYANPMIALLSGAGTLTRTGANTYLLNLGSIASHSGSLTAAIGEANAAAGPADTLAGSFMTGDVPSNFRLSGFGAFNGVGAGQTQGGQTITLDSGQPAGMFSGTLEFDPLSQNASPYSGPLPPEYVTIEGSVVPEPSSVGLGFIAGIGLLRRRRRIAVSKSSAGC